MVSKSRLPYVDVDLSRRVNSQLLSFAEVVQRQLSEEPEKIPQTRYSLLARNLAMRAGFAYALSEPAAEVRALLQSAAEAKLKVFEFRGQHSSFRSELVTISLDASTGDAVDVEREWRTDSDYSLTNSRSGLDGIYSAMATGQLLIAQRLAQLIGDPPNAPYIDPESEVCTPDDQHIAYAMKRYLLGDRDRAAAELDLVSDDDARTAAEARVARALVSHDRDSFFGALQAHLKWHANEAKKKRNQKDATYFLNLPALGLTALALRDGVVSADDLPPALPHFPVELLSMPTA